MGIIVFVILTTEETEVYTEGHREFILCIYSQIF